MLDLSPRRTSSFKRKDSSFWEDISHGSGIRTASSGQSDYQYQIDADISHEPPIPGKLLISLKMLQEANQQLKPPSQCSTRLCTCYFIL